MRDYRWCRSSHGYAVSHDGTRAVYLHRFLTKAAKGESVDHVNGDKLDNRRENLRVCKHSDNMKNRQRGWGASKFKGVGWHKQVGKWRAYIQVEGRHTSLGLYSHEEDAARAYNNAATKYFGQYAKLNEVPQ